MDNETVNKNNGNVDVKKMNASQKIEFLEKTILSYVKQSGQQMEILADEIDKIRNSQVSLSKRLNATIEASNTDDLVTKIMTQRNVEDLEGKVKFLEEQGVLKKNKEAAITENTFVVGRELDSEGNEVNPRIQFAVNSLDDGLKGKLFGHKIGDIVKPEEEEGSYTLEVVDIYDIIDTPIEKNFEDSDPESSETSEPSDEEAKSQTQA